MQKQIQPVSIICVDTKSWRIPEKFKGKARIYSVYVYDENVETFACELKPSYWLHPVTEFVILSYRGRKYENELSELEEKTIYAPHDFDGFYMHCDSADEIKEPFKRRLKPVDIDDDYDDAIERIIEHMNGNPWW